MSDSKEVEKKRYDTRALSNLESNILDSKNKDDEFLRPPLDFYRAQLSNFEGNVRVLELGAGMGENTEILLECGYDVVATDISVNSLKILQERFNKYINLSIKTADIESLPFKDEEFDIVCSAGVLSYGDPDKIRSEVYRVLKMGGIFVAVDTFNHNPIYKFNRYIHYLKQERSKSTLKRMPSLNTIRSYKKLFGQIEVRYFGSILWTAPILSRILGNRLFSELSKKVDGIFKIRKSAFKFVMVVFKKSK